MSDLSTSSADLGGSAPSAAQPTLSMDDITLTYASRRSGAVVGCDRVSFNVPPNGSVGLVGESGHGKSTILSICSAVREPDSGTANFRGQPYRAKSGSWRKEFFRAVQFVGQNPYTAFNPRLSMLPQVAAPARWLLGLGRSEAFELATQTLATVGLAARVGKLKPGSLSGGMLQRAAVARALVSSPECLILDEPTASLSPEGTAEVVAVLRELRREGRCSLLITSHDLDVMAELCDEVNVVYRGQIIDTGPLSALKANSTSEYTQLLMSAWSAHPAPVLPAVLPADFLAEPAATLP
jgi:ABC-type glutathione transport system ATPase component